MDSLFQFEASRGSPLAQRHEHSGRSPLSLCRACDGLTEILLYAMIVGGPWLFGTTHAGTIWAMNGVGYLLGLLLAVKWISRRWASHHHASFGAAKSTRPAGRQAPASGLGSAPLVRVMALLTALILAYCLISALNASATYHYGQFHLELLDHISWLPHSFDRASSWFCFWQYLGLALMFWAARDWLLTQVRSAECGARNADRAARGEESNMASGSGPSSDPDGSRGIPHSALRAPRSALLPVRLRRLLLVLCLNGGLIAAEGIVQRFAGADRMLFFMPPNFPSVEMVFGPYAYRGNASTYLNLVWPVCAVMAWLLARETRRARSAGLRPASRVHAWLAGAAVLMAVSPAISSCRGGTLVAGAELVGVLVIFLCATRKASWRSRVGPLLLFIVALQAAVILSWDPLSSRFQSALSDRLSGRLDEYQTAERITKDYPIFGTGPGSFALAYKFYRPDVKDYWAAQAHDDWLETRITFGWAGFSLILLLLLLVPLNWLVGSGTGIQVRWQLPVALLLAMAGCLLHARFDFPLQIHSILALFVLYCAVLSCLSRRRAEAVESTSS